MFVHVQRPVRVLQRPRAQILLETVLLAREREQRHIQRQQVLQLAAQHAGTSAGVCGRYSGSAFTSIGRGSGCVSTRSSESNNAYRDHAGAEHRGDAS